MISFSEIVIYSVWITHFGASDISLAPIFYKSQNALILLLLLSKLQPLRWVAIWFRVLHWKRQHLYRFDVTAQKFPPPFRFRLAAKTALWWEFLRFRPGFASLDSGPRKTGIRVMARIFFVNTRQLVASVISLATSFLCFASKTHLALILLLLASEPNPLRWASVRFWVQT
ncbi:MAG: hypothetical protein MR648_00795, partial [Clostridiales bacterium]|nr:hypothetical protein [Clostridiales bacterium]